MECNRLTAKHCPLKRRLLDKYRIMSPKYSTLPSSLNAVVDINTHAGISPDHGGVISLAGRTNHGEKRVDLSPDIQRDGASEESDQNVELAVPPARVDSHLVTDEVQTVDELLTLVGEDPEGVHNTDPHVSPEHGLKKRKNTYHRNYEETLITCSSSSSKPLPVAAISS